MGDGQMKGGSSGQGNVSESGLDTDPSRRETLVNTEPPLTQVGRYVLLKRLGEGAMGVVYAAYDPDLDRKVALKLLQPRVVDEPAEGSPPEDAEQEEEAVATARARLLREAQAMARVSHPHVVPVYDVGTWHDQVFLAMELAEEGTLSDWLKGQHPWREVLERFLAAGRGLFAAHEAGLVHRDFKPANVLLGRGGRVYVTDFGLARKAGDLPVDEPPPELAAGVLVPSPRRLLDTALTHEDVVLGTPNYMPPEQYSGDSPDARSDQFSFCVALYWGLYRQRAFTTARMHAFLTGRQLEKRGASRGTLPHGAGRDEAGWNVITPPPRTGPVPAWVGQALMRGMSLEPGNRFASMRELLEALSQDQRRRRGQRRWMAAGAAALGLAVVGGAVYHQSRVCVDADAPLNEVWGAGPAEALTKAFVATGRPDAALTAARVSQVLGEYASGWRRQSIAVCEATRRFGSQTEELGSRRVGCLDRRRQDLRALVGTLGEADGKLVDRALDAAHALPALEECANVGALAEQQPLPADPARRAEIGRLGGELAGVKALLDTGRYRPGLDKALALGAPVLATGHLPLIAEWRYITGTLQSQLGAAPEARQQLVQALYDAESSRSDRLKVSIAHRLLFVDDGQKHYAQAEDWAGLGEAALRRLGGDPAMEADLLVNRSHLAISQEDYVRARELLEKTRALQERALPADHPKRARTLFLLGRVLLDMDERAEAVVLLQEALVRTEAALGRMHPDTGRRHGMLAGLLREMGQSERALEHARAALAVNEATFGTKHLDTASSLDEVGMCLLELGRPDEALVSFERALALKRELLAPEDEELQYSYDGVGQALLKLGRPREALAPLRQAVTFASARSDALGESGFALARALWESGERGEARGEAVRARARFDEAGLAPRVSEVDAWLQALPEEPKARERRVPPRIFRKIRRR